MAWSDKVIFKCMGIYFSLFHVRILLVPELCGYEWIYTSIVHPSIPPSTHLPINTSFLRCLPPFLFSSIHSSILQFRCPSFLPYLLPSILIHPSTHIKIKAPNPEPELYSNNRYLSSANIRMSEHPKRKKNEGQWSCQYSEIFLPHIFIIINYL